MAKSSGLGDALFYAGYDLSGDVGSVQTIRHSLGELVVTGLNKSAYERIAGQRDGQIDFKAYYNPSTGQEHPVLDAIPTADQIVSYCRGTTLGNPVASMVGKEFDFSENRAANGALEDSIVVKGNGHAINWGVQLTAGQRTDIAATNGTGVAIQDAIPTAVSISSVSVANPTHIVTTTAHGLVTGDSVLIAGTTTTPSVNGNFTVTRVSDTEFTIPVNVTVGAGAAGTAQKTSTDFGWAAYLHKFAGFLGTDVTVKLQDSDDGITYADLAGGSFTQITGATPSAERIAAASPAIVRQFVRAVTITSAGFTSLTFAVSFVRYLTSVAD